MKLYFLGTTNLEKQYTEFCLVDPHLMLVNRQLGGSSRNFGFTKWDPELTINVDYLLLTTIIKDMSLVTNLKTIFWSKLLCIGI